MESTGVLWRSAYESLESVGYNRKNLVVLNARTVKALMGKKLIKTMQDARRLAKFMRVGDFNASFIPSPNFRLQRAAARKYSKSVANLNSLKQEKCKLLNEIGLRVSSVFSDLHGKSSTKIIEAYLRGEDLLKAIRKYRDPRCHHSVEEIFNALKFELTPDYRDLVEYQDADIAYAIKAKDRNFKKLQAIQASISALY